MEVNYSQTIIVFNYPTYLDAENIVSDNIVWAKHREVPIRGRKEKRPQVIALIRGEAPDRLFVPGIGYKYVDVYKGGPPICYKCSKWGHMAYKCINVDRCRFCAKQHDSRECSEKIKKKEKVVPKCSNCGEGHNAQSMQCKKRPQLAMKKQNANKSPEPIQKQPLAKAPAINVWEERIKSQQARNSQPEPEPQPQPQPQPEPQPEPKPKDDLVTALCEQITSLTMIISDLQKEMKEVKDIIKSKESEESNNEVSNSNKNVAKTSKNNGKGIKSSSKVNSTASCSAQKKERNEKVESSVEIEKVLSVLTRVLEFVKNPRDDQQGQITQTVETYVTHIKENGVL